MIIKQKKMSSAINNHDYTSYHLPRGYFKRRKPPDENDDEDRNNTTCQPSLHRYSDSLRCRFSDKGRVNKNFLLSCTLVTLILTIMINGVAGDDRLRRALEDNALHTTPVPSTLPNDGSEYWKKFFVKKKKIFYYVRGRLTTFIYMLRVSNYAHQHKSHSVKLYI